MAERRFSPVRSVLVGRDTELERLQAALDDTLGGAGRVVLVSGEPGIGKTRLVEELAARATDQGAVVAWGRVDDAEGAPPYSPWAQLLETVLAAVDENVVGEALGADAGPIAAILPEVKEYVAEITPPPLLDPAAARFRLHAAIVDFMARVGAHRPLVLVLEDLHWADVPSLELTRFAANRLRAVPVMLVVTYRSVDDGGSEHFVDVLGSLAREPTLERIVLGGLTEPEVGRFMAQTIGVRPRPAVVATVHARTEGNPFFVTELARLLQSEGGLDAAGGPGRPAVPAAVGDVLRRRLRRLPAHSNELLVVGAVVGREFDVATLAATADVTEADAADGIEAALSAGVLEEPAGPVGPGGRVRFSHALVRDAIYGGLSALRRATLHARVGAVLEQRHGAARSHLAELAWHFFHAAPIVGPERGLGYALEAAEAAQASLAYEAAEDELRRALALVGLLPAGHERLGREIQVQNRLATLLATTRGFAAIETAEAWSRGRELYAEKGDAREQLLPLFGLFIVHSTRADHRTGAAIGRELLELGEAVGDRALVLAGHDILGLTGLYRGELADARDHLEQSLALTATFDDAALLAIFPVHPGGVNSELAVVCYLQGDVARAEEVHAQAKAVRDRLSHPLSVGPMLVLDLWLQVCQGALGTLPEDGADVSRRCKDWGLAQMAALADLWGAWALEQRDGRARTAVIAEALAVLDASGFRIWRTQHLALLAESYRLRGDADEALRLLEEGVTDARRNDERFWEPELLRLRGELMAGSDPSRAGEAVDSVNGAVTLARAQGSVVLEARALATLAALGAKPAQAAKTTGGEGGLLLSPREREVVGLFGRGLTDKEIARDLMISLATVHSHLDRIRDKTGRRRRTELTRLAVELGLTSG